MSFSTPISRGFTFSGVWVSIMETLNREPPSKRKENPDGRDRKPKPHEMGMQVPHCVHTERSKKSVVRSVEETIASGVS